MIALLVVFYGRVVKCEEGESHEKEIFQAILTRVLLQMKVVLASRGWCVKILNNKLTAAVVR